MIRLAILILIVLTVLHGSGPSRAANHREAADSLMAVLEHNFRAHPRAVRMDFVTQFVKRESVLKRTMWGLIGGNPGESWFMYVITQPRFMEGTTLLFQDWSDPARADSIWLYLPSFQTFRALDAPSQRSIVPGTALTYEDSRGFIPLDKYDVALADSLPVKPDDSTLTIIAQPKSREIATNVGYHALTITADRRMRIITHIEYRDIFARVTKTYDVLAPVQHGGIWYPETIRVEQQMQQTISIVHYEYWPLESIPPEKTFAPSLASGSFLQRLAETLDAAGIPLDLGAED